MHKLIPDKSSRFPSLFMFISCLCAVFLFVSCDRDGDEDESDEIAVRTVQVKPVKKGSLLETITLVGELQGVEEVRILALVTDRIRRLAVKEGDMVKSGDLLAIVASEITSQAVEQAEAGLEAATAARDALEREIARIRPLVDAGSAPRSQLESLETQLRTARAQVRQAGAGAGQASVQQRRTTIRSPISGLVTNITAQEGEIAPPSMPLMTIVRPDRLKAVIRAPERHFLRIDEGMSVNLTQIARPDKSVNATVTLKGPIVDRMTRTGLIEIEIDNSDGLLVPGSMVRAEIEISRQDDIILAPAEAVIFTVETEHTGRAVIFTAGEDKAHRRDITVGARQDGMIEIREGLGEGEIIITRGAQFLRDKNPIRWSDNASLPESGNLTASGMVSEKDIEATKTHDAENSSNSGGSTESKR